VATARNGDTILITGAAVNHGINLMHGELLLTQQNLTIETAANKSPATISGDHLSRLFEVAAGASVTLSNLVLTGGMVVDNGGGILVDPGAALTVSGCTVSGNQAGIGNGNGGVTAGGGIENGGTLTVTGSIVSGNSANWFGGGIDNYGTATVSNSTLSGNSAIHGGGIFSGSMLTVSGCTLSGNSAAIGGGIESGGTLTLTGSIVSGNYIGNDTFNGPNVIVHELGHYCGGRDGSGKEIAHLCTPNPKPFGKPGDEGKHGHNFLTMTPEEALRNVYSYQAFAHAPDGFGPPATGPV
jgi:hypothetical protein